MRAGLKIINNFCSLPTCSETKCKMNGKKSKLFSDSFYIRQLCCSKCPRIYFSTNASDTVYSDKVPLGCYHILSGKCLDHIFQHLCLVGGNIKIL